MGNTEEIYRCSRERTPLFATRLARLPAVQSRFRSREAETRMHNFMMDDAAYRLRRDSDFYRPICIIEQI